MAKVSRRLDRGGGRRIKAAGLDSIAGAGAEMLPDRPRKAIAPLKESGERWLEVMEVAHRLGVESTATMMMGTGETNAERIEHLRMIRDVQDRTGGFRAFIPWTYQPENNHLKGRTQATTLEYLRLIAVARLFFDNVAHLQASWLTTGKDVGQLSLHMGVDDLGSIMLEENVISSAGARHRSNLHELIWMIRTAGRIPAQRDTLYRHLAVHRTPGRRPDRRPGRLALLVDRPARRRRGPEKPAPGRDALIGLTDDIAGDSRIASPEGVTDSTLRIDDPGWMQNSSVSLLSAVVAGFILFLLGGAWARMKSANRAYKTIKNGVKPARKLFWLSLGGVVKIGFWVVVLLALLVFWQVRDVNAGNDGDPVVPAEVQPSGR